jgi:hypothetical protein
MVETNARVTTDTIDALISEIQDIGRQLETGDEL